MGEVDPKLGELIKRKRLERKLAQEQTAELVGCKTQYYKNLENGCGKPSVPMFCRIMRALNISADDYIYPNKNSSLAWLLLSYSSNTFISRFLRTSSLISLLRIFSEINKIRFIAMI